MANVYTSIATTPGLADNTVKTMYDFFFRWALNETPIYRQFVDVTPQAVNGPAKQIVLQKYNYLDETAVTAAKTPLNEELDVDARKMPATSPVTLNLNEYGDAAVRTKQINLYSFADVDMAIVEALSDQSSKVIDELVQDTMLTGTQVLRAAGRASTATVAATDYLTSGVLRKAVTKLRRNQVRTWDSDGSFAIGTHPDVVHDLREETGAGGWRLPHEYAAGNQDALFRGEIGKWEGLRFYENARTRTGTDGASSAKVYRSYVLGREAVVEKMLEEPSVQIGPVTDKLNRFKTFGWTFVGGWALYRNESIVRLESASSVASI